MTQQVINTTGGATGFGAYIKGGSSSGAAFVCEAVSGNAMWLVTSSGHGLVATGAGSGKNGIRATGGSGLNSDGLYCVSADAAGFRADAFLVTGLTTLTGAVSLGSTLGVTGTTTLAAVGTGAITATTITTSGTVTFNAFTVTAALTAGTNAVPWNAAWDAEVQSEVDDALVAQRLDELLNADSDIDGAAPPTVGSVFHELMTSTAGSFTFDQSTDSLEALRNRGEGE